MIVYRHSVAPQADNVAESIYGYRRTLDMHPDPAFDGEFLNYYLFGPLRIAMPIPEAFPRYEDDNGHPA
jgi:hypothetical protein